MEFTSYNYEGHRVIKYDDVLTFGAYNIFAQTLKTSSSQWTNTLSEKKEYYFFFLSLVFYYFMQIEIQNENKDF